MTICAITFAELAAAPHLADDPSQAALRQARLQEVESSFEPVPFDAAAARSYGLVVTAVTSAGRRHRSRVADLLIAATAHANGFDLYTRNPDDFAAPEGLITVVGL
jgi:predicted nucleic acid-binding protein